MIVASTPEECARAAGGARPFVVTIGNFDGCASADQALIRRTVNRAHKLGLRALAVTFEPHPAGVLTDNPPPALSSARQRLDLLASLGMDATLLMPFTLELASVSAEEFCRCRSSRRLCIRMFCLSGMISVWAGIRPVPRPSRT